MKTKNLAIHLGEDGIEPVTTRKRFKELYQSDEHHRVVWGADERDGSLDCGGGDLRNWKIHPGVDYQFGAARSMAQVEWARVKAAGVPLRSNLFRGEDAIVEEDLNLLFGIRDGEYKRHGRDAAWLFDAAPNLYIAQETIRQTGEIIEEDLVEMSARTLIPSVTLNTWMDAYRYDRVASKLSSVAMPIALDSLTEQGVPQSSYFQRTPVYKPLEFFRSGASWEFFELERLAEARSNGAPNLDIVNDRLKNARLEQEVTYNFTTLFGFPMSGRQGLFDALVAANRTVGAAQQLGANNDPEEDLAIFVDNWTEMIVSSVNIERPDTIALGTGAWVYINTTDYKSTDAGMNESLAQAIMRQLGPLGLKDIVWAPEMDYRAEQETAWQEETSLPAALAAKWAGGLNGENVILMYQKDVEKGRMVIGKPIAARPQETVQDRTTVNLIQSLGDYDLRRPISQRLITDVGPATA